MSITGIKSAIVTALEGISSLTRVYDQWPENINETPCALVLPKHGEFQVLGGRTLKQYMEVTLLVKRVGDIEQGQEDLDSYLDDSTEANSVCHWIEASTAYEMRVVGWRDYGGMQYPPGSQNVFLGVRFDVEAID